MLIIMYEIISVHPSLMKATIYTTTIAADVRFMPYGDGTANTQYFLSNTHRHGHLMHNA